MVNFDNDGPNPGFVVVGFTGKVLVDDDGPDLAVHLIDFHIGAEFETFEVLASQDGSTFVSLGIVSPTTPAPPNVPETVLLDLAGSGLDTVSQVKILNTTLLPDPNDPSFFPAFEGPDIDAIEALNCAAPSASYFIVIGNITEVDGEPVTGKYYCRGVFTDPAAVGLPPLIPGTPPSGGLTFVEQRFRIDGRGTIVGSGDEGDAPLAILGGTGDFIGVHGSYTPSGFPVPLGAGTITFDFRLRRG